MLLLLLAPSPEPTAVEQTGRDVGIIAGVIVCLAVFIALILIIIYYRSVIGDLLHILYVNQCYFSNVNGYENGND